MLRRVVVALVLASLVPVAGPAAAQDWGLRRGTKRPPAKRPPGKRPPAKAPDVPPAVGGETDPHRRMLPILLERYRRAVESDPSGGFALRRMLEVERELHGSVEALVEEYRRRAASDADPFVAQMVLGHLHEQAARHDEAIAAFRAAAAARPRSPDPLLAIAEVARASGDRAGARRSLADALERIDDRTRKGEVLRTSMELALEDDDLAAARAAHEAIVRLSPDSVFVRLELGQALAARGRHAEAIEAFEAVLPFARGDARAAVPVYKELARAQLDAGRLDDAQASIRLALRGAPAGSGLRGELWDLTAEIHRRREDLPALIRELEGVRGAEPEALLARLYDEVGDEAHALAAYRRALARNPRDLDTRLRVVNLLQRSGRLREVTEEYRTLVRVSPGEPRFVIELADHLMNQGDRAGAMRIVEQAAQRHGRDESVLTALATLYARWGETERATRLLQTLARVAPNDPDHVIALGEQYDQSGDRAHAIETWRRLLVVIPGRAESRAALADVFADHAMLPEAVALYREAVQLSPDDLDLVKGLASALERNRELPAAAEAWQHVLDLAGEDRTLRREARTRIVGIWALEGSLAGHQRTLEERFAGDPPDLDAGRFLGEAYLKRRRLDDAARVLRRVAEAAPGDVETLLGLERVLVQQDQLAEAIEVCKRLAELDPTHARELYERIAQYALATYRDDEAAEYASRAVQLDPGNAGAHARLGELYRSRQDFDRAIEEYRRAVELDDRQFPLYFELAQLLLVRGRSREADGLYRQVIRRATDDDLVSRAARESIQIHEAAGTLDELEQDLLPIALAQTRRPVYRRLVVELYASLARRLVDRVRRGDDADRAAAREALRRIGVRGLKPLLEALSDPDPAQKRAAIGVLGYLDNPNAATALFAAAEAEGDAEVSARALVAAVAVAGPEHAARLEALTKNREGRIRATALWGLARLGGRRALPVLQNGAQSDIDTVRTLACDGLGRIGDEAVVPLLVTRLREDRAQAVRASAALALGRLGGGLAVDALVEALRVPRGLVGRAAAIGLGLAGDPRGVDVLARAAFASDPEVRKAASWALATIGAEGPRPTLGEVDYMALPDARLDPSTFVAALFDRVPASPPLWTALVRHADSLKGAVEVALSPEESDAAVVLEAMDGATGIALAPFTDELPAEGADRDAALAALRAVTAGVTPEVALLVRSEAAPIRARAVSVLGRIGGPVARDALASAASRPVDSDPDETVLGLAVDALAQTGDPAAVPPLVSALQHSRRWSIRTAAAVALGRLRAASAVPALVAALREDDFAFVRSAAADALGEIGSGAAAGDLEAARTHDPEPRVREAASRAARRLRNPR